MMSILATSMTASMKMAGGFPQPKWARTSLQSTGSHMPVLQEMDNPFISPATAKVLLADWIFISQTAFPMENGAFLKTWDQESIQGTTKRLLLSLRTAKPCISAHTDITILAGMIYFIPKRMPMVPGENPSILVTPSIPPMMTSSSNQ